MLFDAVVTAPLEAYWTSLVLNKSEWVTHFMLLLSRSCYKCFYIDSPQVESCSQPVLSATVNKGNVSDDATDKM